MKTDTFPLLAGLIGPGTCHEHSARRVHGSLMRDVDAYMLHLGWTVRLRGNGGAAFLCKGDDRLELIGKDGIEHEALAAIDLATYDRLRSKIVSMGSFTQIVELTKTTTVQYELFRHEPSGIIVQILHRKNPNGVFADAFPGLMTAA